MKNFKLITLCALLFATQHLSAQFAVYTEGYGAGATFADFGGSTNNVTEDMTMANAHTGTKSLRAEVPATNYTGGAIKAATPQNLTAYTAVTFWVRASASKTLNVTGFANNATAAPHQTEKVNIPVSTTWTKVTITIPNPAILTAEDGLFHFAEGSDEGAYTLWFDDIKYENIPVVGDPAPATAAPTPTRAAANVISLFSGTPYTDLMGTNWNPYHGTTGYSEVPIATNTTQKYTNLDYSVSEAASNIDLTAYTGFHVDFWSATAVNFKVKLVDFGADGAFGGGDDKEGEVDKGTQAAGTWVSLDILLSDFAALGLTTKAHLRQLVISTSSASPIVYLDNLYFYKPAVVLPTEPTVAAPTPTRPAANVISLFSDASGYTNVAGTDFFPNWGQSTVVADVMVAGNPTKKYTTMNYQGIQFATSVNASAMTNLHFDLWTPNCTAFEVSLINTSPSTVEQPVTVMPTLSGWNSFDIPLSSYTNINKANIGQIKLVATPFGSSTVYLDNLYFWTTVTPATITNFTVPAKMVGDAAFTLTAPTSNSSGAFTYMSSNPSVATISGTTVTIVGGGTSVITATQAAAGAYGSASITANLVVSFAVPMVAATTPTRLAANVISLFSGAYTDIAGTDWFPNWGQSTVVTDVMIAGNPTKKYDNLNYQGIQLASPINVSTMQKLHFDLWTPNCTSFEVSLINQGIGEQPFTVIPTTLGWNSFDIALTNYNTVNLANVGQIKSVGLPSGSAVVYIDNVYFWKAPVIPVELVSFKAKAVNNTTVLNWNTATERSNQGFTIERSVNGTTYTAIGQVKGNGSSNVVHDYTFIDNTPSVNTNYYRLRQTDFDGKETLSAVVSVLFGKGGLVLKNTLAHDVVDIVVGDALPVTVSVFNVAGQEIFTTKMQGARSINVSAWEVGLYIVRTSTGEVGRFVKQ